ncbi:unnamed protein product, partial [Allacma fusca]
VLKGECAANLLIQLSSYLNFSYEFVLAGNKTLTHRFEEASNLSIDLFAASYSLTKQRIVIADPTFAIASSRIKILTLMIQKDGHIHFASMTSRLSLKH